MKRTRVHQLSGYLKISCTALLVSGQSLVMDLPTIHTQILQRHLVR